MKWYQSFAFLARIPLKTGDGQTDKLMEIIHHCLMQSDVGFV